MGWTVRLFRIAGIPIRLHATMILLVAWWLFPTWARVFQGGPAFVDDAIRELIVLAALFANIVLHELGHALVARRYGARTVDIVLLPIGGVARMDKMPKAPRAELAVALAGPAVSLAISVLAFAFTIFLAGASLRLDMRFAGTSVIAAVAWLNLILFAFNLLPAFPMDGGRALRALLASRMSYARATTIAAHVGQGFALLIGLVGLLVNPMLIFVALFVWIGAADEARAAAAEDALRGVPASRAMMRDVRVLEANASLGDAADMTLDGSQRDFPVIAGGEVRGLLTQQALLRALVRDGRDAPVLTAMDAVVAHAAPDEPLATVVERMHAANAPALVMANGKLQGLITPENVVELIALADAARLHDKLAQPQPPDVGARAVQARVLPVANA